MPRPSFFLNWFGLCLILFVRLFVLILFLLLVFVRLFVLTYLVVICLGALVVFPSLPLLQAIKGTRQYAE